MGSVFSAAVMILHSPPLTPPLQGRGVQHPQEYLLPLLRKEGPGVVDKGRGRRPSPQPLPIGRGVNSSELVEPASYGLECNYSPPYREGPGVGPKGLGVVDFVISS